MTLVVKENDSFVVVRTLIPSVHGLRVLARNAWVFNLRTPGSFGIDVLYSLQ